MNNHYFIKAKRASDNALRCMKRRRNRNRAKYWNHQTFHYFELCILRNFYKQYPDRKP